MSLADVKTKQEQCLNDIYTSLENKGATIPEKKNLVNVATAIESIEGGGSEPPMPQVINYKMIYDGSLGEAGENGANVCDDVTGGYGLNGHAYESPYILGEAELQATNLYMKTTTNGNYSSKSSFCTNDVIDITNYSKLCFISKGIFDHYNQFGWMSICLGDVPFGVREEQKNRIGIAGSTDGNIKISIADLSTAQIDKYYFQGYISAGGYVSSSSAKLYVYGAALLKEDNWQELCSIAGLNANNYTDETALCENSTAVATILNNKEAVMYMMYNCTGTFMGEFIKSSTALNELNRSVYKILIYSNEHWLKFLSFAM